MKINKSKLQTGFTIIEVMIVLAIAGLIMVIVFLAVPQLQRSQRNTARKSVANRIKTELDNSSSNNNGAIPTSGPTLATFVTKYLTSVNYQDPSTGVNMPLGFAPLNDHPALGTFDYRSSSVCDPANPENPIASTSARNYAAWISLEPFSATGPQYCLDNH